MGRQRFFGKQRVIFGLTGTVCDLTVTQIPTCEDIVCTLWNSKVCLSVVSDILLRFIRRAGIIQVKADFHLCLTFKALLQVFERMACCNSRVNIIAQRGRKGVILLFCRSDRLHIGIVSADGFQRSLHFICIGFVLRRRDQFLRTVKIIIALWQVENVLAGRAVHSHFFSAVAGIGDGVAAEFLNLDDGLTVTVLERPVLKCRLRVITSVHTLADAGIHICDAAVI